MLDHVVPMSERYREKLSKIKVFLTDCDGCLTNGEIFWSGEEVGWNRFFNTQDGYGLKVLQEAGLYVGIISGGESLGLKNRIENLNLKYSFLGNTDKREGYLKMKEISGAKDEEILYIGDELFDMPLLKKAGFSACTPHSVREVKEVCDYVTRLAGGMGAVREVVELVKHAQNIMVEIPDFD
jgi:3-deoxy-D-manno-octulosonate 8-phosphate phosphatase (KDO 8-P phosphatase)